MWLPNLTQQYTQSLYTTQFLGLNRNPVTADGEFSDMKNLTSDSFPVMSPRKPYSFVYPPETTPPTPGGADLGLLAKDALCRVTNTGGTVKLFINDTLATGVTLTNTAKQLISMGAYIIIWPDKCYVNTKSTPFVIQKMEQENNLSGTAIQVAMTRLNGDAFEDVDYTKVSVGPAAPTEPENGAEWVDTSSTPNTLKRWNAGTSEWVQTTTTYCRITGAAGSNIAQGLKDYDTVTVSGLTSSNTDDNDQLKQFNTDLIVYKVQSNDSFVVAGIVSEVINIAAGDVTAFKVHRRVPDCNFITEANNRLWGCYYGLVGGKPVNEIYACKLGDPTNWYSYMGLSTDSYAVTVGSDGQFTGACTLKGYPLFFKENCLHRIAGQYPANYTLTTTQCRGVQKGSSKSLCVVGERLYYKGRTDIMCYDGSVPVAVSDALGHEDLYYGAEAGAYGSRYYICMRGTAAHTSDSEYTLFMLDTDKGLWYKQQSGWHFSNFAQLDDELYAWTQYGLVAINGTTGVTEGWDNFGWSGTFGIYGYEYEDQKYLSRFNIRMKLAKDTAVRLLIQYDSDGVWHEEGVVTGRTTETFTLPVIPRRCDHCQIRIDGCGPAKIFSIGRVLEGGSDGNALHV